ncbi:single-stranded DNA-binding protein [Nonomuraea roseoviolacea]|uniref:Single-stranded DNA-binding protein n=1 Tax=Nonomuraea roseoviolacea subsp. carminata TaxID=160689 RepID=A0ABT1K9T7_9ACTN|nr:single-stranded DNA-binding protein [Nonomuraea roseoviolacea]MCP2350780.1 hypothetical protein [Nonomuraea roseoviolacea subsp. carminata]
MDRNEVVLAGRVSAAAEDKRLPSGDTLTRWRLAVRRDRPHPKGGVMTDSIPCVTFVPEVAAVVRDAGPDDPLEVRGAFRCRIYGPSSAKIWRYEVEVFHVEPARVDPASPPPGPRRRTTRGPRPPKPAPAAPPDGEAATGQDPRDPASLPVDALGVGASAAPSPAEPPRAETESLVGGKPHEPTPRGDSDASPHMSPPPSRLQAMIDTCRSAGKGVLSRTHR